MAPPKKKPRTTLVQKTAEEGQALLKEMGFSEQDTPGRRSTRASAKGIVYTPPPKRERKTPTPSSGEAKRRGRPRKAKVASASLDESEEAMEVSEQEDKEDAVETKDKSQKEESDSKENSSKAKVSPKKAPEATKTLATLPQVKQTKESLQKAIDQQVKPAASQKPIEQPKSTSPLKIPDQPKITTSPQKVPEQPKSVSPLKLIEQPKTVPQKDKPVSLPQKTAELAKLASTHPPKAPDSKPITISSSKDSAEKPLHKTSPESSSTDKLPNIQHAVKSPQSTTTPANSKNISLSPAAVVVPPSPLPSYSPYSTKPATTTQPSNVIIVPPKSNMSSTVDTLVGNAPLSKVPLPTYSPTKPAAVPSNVFSKSNEVDKPSAAPRVSHHSISPPKTASSLPGSGGGGAEQPGTTPKSPPLIKADFSLNSKLSQSPPKSIFSSSPTSFSSMSKTPLFGSSSSVAAKPSQVAGGGGASALLSQSIGAPPPSSSTTAKPASISASLGSTKPFGGSGSVPVSCPLIPPTTNSPPSSSSSVVSGASSATPGSAAHPPPTVQ